MLQKCTAGFLDVLVTTLLGRDGELDDDDLGPAAKRTKALINAVFQEIHRLQLHPGLYPTKDMGERFIDEVKDIVTSRGNDFKLTHLIPDPETWNSLGATLGMEDLLEQLTRRDDLTLWEEFLFPGSPGSGFVLPPSNRLLPPGGTTMMALWHKKTASVEEEIKAVSPNPIMCNAKLTQYYYFQAAARKNGQPAQPEHPLFPDGIGSIDFGGMKHDFQIVSSVSSENIYSFANKNR